MAEVIEVRGLEAIQRQLALTPERMRQAAWRGCVDGGNEVLRFMKTNMLTGQRLRVQTGKLRSNWAMSLPTQSGPPGVTVTTNTEYAPRHEYGFSGFEHVKPHVRTRPRRRTRGGRLVRRKGDTGESIVQVQGFEREAFTPAKHYLRDSIALSRERVAQLIERKLRRAWGGGQ